MHACYSLLPYFLYVSINIIIQISASINLFYYIMHLFWVYTNPKDIENQDMLKFSRPLQPIFFIDQHYSNNTHKRMHFLTKFQYLKNFKLLNDICPKNNYKTSVLLIKFEH